jgi:hypothetical protein
MNHEIKIEKARKMTKWGQYGRTFDECIEAIPAEIIAVLTGRQLAVLIDANQEIYAAGKAKEAAEAEEYLGCP